MTITAIVLLVVAAFTHAGWNLLSKHRQSNIPTFLTASILGLVILVPFVALFGSIIPGFMGSTWLFIAATGCFQAIYYASLSAGYRSGDMSIVYPVARSLPALLVVGAALVTGRGELITPLMIVGTILIVVGSAILPMTSFSSRTLAAYRSSALLFAFIAAVGTAGYSLVDARALEMLRDTLGTMYAAWQVTAVYAFFEGVSSGVWLLLFAMVSHRQRRLLKTGAKVSVKQGIVLGIGIYFTYTIVLTSMAFVREVSYVVAFRQLSIPIGVLLSGVLLKERMHAPRILGSMLMFTGVVLVGIG